MVDLIKTTEKIPLAVLQFLSGWRTIQQGRLVPGEKLAIEYDPARLPQCRQWFRGALFGDIEVYVRFHPGGQFYTGSVLEEIRAMPGGPVIELKPARYEVTVPMDAAQVEIWFRGFYQTTSFHEAWDSREGQNYWFQVVDR